MTFNFSLELKFYLSTRVKALFKIFFSVIYDYVVKFDQKVMFQTFAIWPDLDINLDTPLY